MLYLFTNNIFSKLQIIKIKKRDLYSVRYAQLFALMGIESIHDSSKNDIFVIYLFAINCLSYCRLS